MRNLASGNKMRFTMFTFIVIAILVILVCAVITVLKQEKEQYQVLQSAFIYDHNYNYVELENSAVISKKWTGNYYLKEDITNKEYKLGDYAVSYDTRKNTTDLFGTFYQVLKGGNINKISDYNTINSSTEDKFYKIDDRKYLIIARNIENDTGSLSTSNYLIIIVDKLGNALLLNNELNIKTINEMIISTDDFSFDVANEILRFDNEQVNLKKIIGSSNEYVPTVKNEIEENETEDNDIKHENSVVIGNAGGTNINSNTTNNTTTNNSNTTNIIQNGTNINAGNVNNNNNNNNSSSEDRTWVDSLNGWIGNVSDAFESIYNNNNSTSDKEESKLNKSISLDSINVGTTYLDINYTVTDPESKYNVVFATITNGKQIHNISLDKNAKTYKLTGLDINTEYTIQLGYKIVFADGTSTDTIEASMTVKTNKPTESIVVTKVGLEKIYYTLKLDNTFIYDTKDTANSPVLRVYKNDNVDVYEEVKLSSTDIEKAVSTGYIGVIEKPKDGYNSISIQLENTYYNGNSINTNLKTTIINY